MKRAALALGGVLAVLLATSVARAERRTQINVTIENKSQQKLTLTMHDERAGQTFVTTVNAGAKRSIGLQSSQSSDDCCGSVSWEGSDGSRSHRENLKHGDVITVP